MNVNNHPGTNQGQMNATCNIGSTSTDAKNIAIFDYSSEKSHAFQENVESKQQLINSTKRIKKETTRPESFSVEERPLVIHFHSKKEKTETESTFEDDSKSKLDQPGPTKRKSSTHESSTAQSSLFSSFTSWKTSAGYVFESIREKFSYFRRPQNTEAISKPKNTQSQQPSNHIQTKQMSNKSTYIASDSDESRSTIKSMRALSSRNKSSSSADTSTDKTLVDEAEVCSLYDNDNSTPKRLGERSHFPSQNANLNPSTSLNLLSKVAPELDKRKNILAVDTYHKDASCSNSSITCSPCLGPKIHQEPLTIESQTDEEPQKIKQFNLETSQTSVFPKIIYDQPSNSQPAQLKSVEHFAELKSDSLSPSEEHSEALSRPTLMSIPDVTLQSATPSCSVNKELNLQCNFNDDGEISKESSDGNLDILVSSDTSDYASIRDKKDSISFEIAHDRRTNDDECDVQYGINMWNLRESLEQNTIEMHCPITVFNDFEENNSDRRFSITTDGMTEASPLSTPSSEFNNFRGKSMSDSEDDGRAYFVTPSGRISPRQPYSHQKATSGFSSSLDRTSNDNNSKTDEVFASVDYPPTTRIYSYSSDFVCSPTPKNILVTQATIEGPRNAKSTEESSHLAKNISEDSAADVSSSSACEEKRTKFCASSKWSTVSDGDEIYSDIADVKPPQAVSRSKKALLYRLPRQTSLPLPTEHSIMHLPDCIEEYPMHYHSEPKNDPFSKTKGSLPYYMNQQSPNRKITGGRGRLLYSSNSISSDEVFLSDSQSNVAQSVTNYWPSNTYRTTRCDPRQIFSHKSQHVSRAFNHAGHSLTNSDTMLAPPARKLNQRSKFRNKLGSGTSSGTSSPTSPSSSASDKPPLKTAKSVDIESDDSLSSRTSSSKSSSSIRSLTKIFRRSTRNRQRSDSAPTFCGYSMERDYCVDFETDRIFKKFLTSASTNESSPPLPAGERLPPPSHMLPPPPLKASSQLRRQVMRKQYSDSIAMYYGQRQRRWRFITKQKSDSVNCPIDRAVFRRQDRIDEEFDPEEINERLSSTSSHRDSERQPEFVPPTVYELREWRRSSEDRKEQLSHTSSLPTYRDHEEPVLNRPTRRVTFERTQIEPIRARSHEETRT